MDISTTQHIHWIYELHEQAGLVYIGNDDWKGTYKQWKTFDKLLKLKQKTYAYQSLLDQDNGPREQINPATS